MCFRFFSRSKVRMACRTHFVRGESTMCHPGPLIPIVHPVFFAGNENEFSRKRPRSIPTDRGTVLVLKVFWSHAKRHRKPESQTGTAVDLSRQSTEMLEEGYGFGM